MAELTKADVRALAEMAMEDHGLDLEGFTFRLSNARTEFGSVTWGPGAKREIAISWPLAKKNGLDETLDTILHECAHALVGPSHGHDWVWKAKALEIGARPERCSHGEGIEPKWLLVCPVGHVRGKRHRRTNYAKTRSCGTCSPGRFDPDARLRYEPNPAAE